MKYHSKYEYSLPFGNPVHVWSVIGRHLAIHLRLTDIKNHGLSGGIELHHREPPEYMADEAPSDIRCELLQGPCWHDGSSMAATEFWIPFWQSAPHDHDRMFAALQAEIEGRQKTTREKLADATGVREEVE